MQNLNPAVAPDAGSPNAGLETIRMIAGWIAASGIVFIVIALVISLTIWALGRLGHATRVQVTAIGAFTRVTLGAALIASVSGLIWWGSGLGGADLMPAVAQRPTVDITKKPAKTTCANEVSYNKPEGRNYLTEAERDRYADALLGPADAERVKTQNIGRFTWTPVGPDCTSKTLEPDACKQVTVQTIRESARGDFWPTESRYNPRTASACTTKEKK
jgi:hypothetical protein